MSVCVRVSEREMQRRGERRGTRNWGDGELVCVWRESKYDGLYVLRLSTVGTEQNESSTSYGTHIGHFSLCSKKSKSIWH